MSTRATYSIETNDRTQYFYIHYDNYEEGAAHYFMQMHNAISKRNCLAMRFIIGNKDYVEFTKDHSCHGDTEYRYYIDKDGNLTMKKEYDGQWIVKYSGHYAEFINSYIKKAYGESYNEYKHKLIEYKRKLYPWHDKDVTEWISKEKLKERAINLISDTFTYADDNPNKKNAIEQAREIDLYLQYLKD